MSPGDELRNKSELIGSNNSLLSNLSRQYFQANSSAASLRLKTADLSSHAKKKHSDCSY